MISRGAAKSSPPPKSASAGDRDRERARVGVRVAVGDEDAGGATVALDRELRRHAQTAARPGSRRRWRRRSRCPPGGRRDPVRGGRFGGRPRRRSRSRPRRRTAGRSRDRARSRSCGPASRASPTRTAACTGSRGRPSARGNTLAPPPGTNPNGSFPGGAVDRLVVGAVAGEHDERVGFLDRFSGQVGRVTLTPRSAARRPPRGLRAQP